MRHHNTITFVGKFTYDSKNGNELIIDLDAEGYSIPDSYEEQGYSDWRKFEIEKILLNGKVMNKSQKERFENSLPTKFWDLITEHIWENGW